MSEALIQAVRTHLLTKQGREIPFPPASIEAVEEAERALGFRIPELLKSLYLLLGNGGYGPGRLAKIVGVQGGFAASAGTLAAVYDDLRRGAKYLGMEWRSCMLPFCDWGCAMFSCVDCNDAQSEIYFCEECRTQPMGFGIEGFIQRWLRDEDLLECAQWEEKTTEMINLFTKKKMMVKGRRLKG